MLMGTLFTIVLLTGCRGSGKVEKVRKELFGTFQGKDVYLLTLTNKKGNVIRLTNYGAKINWIEVPDKQGKKENITFGYDTFEETVSGDMSFGSTVGRYANRIANGKFAIDSVVYTLPLNNGPNTLHGGPGGWHSVVWNTEVLKDSKVPAVRFVYYSKDMEMGFPGNVNAEIVYTWTDNNEILMDYKCTTDKKTVVNVTIQFDWMENGQLKTTETLLSSDESESPDKGNDNTGKFNYGNAIVESIQITVLESFPVQIKVNARGYLPDGCTKIGDITEEKKENTFFVRILSEVRKMALAGHPV